MRAHTNFEINLNGIENPEKSKIWEFIMTEFPENSMLIKYKRGRTGKLKSQSFSTNNPTGTSFRDCFPCEKDDAPTISVEENYSCVWLEDVIEMTRKLVKCAEKPFIINGTIDASGTSGELMDFKITVTDGKIAVASSCWYFIQEAEMYANAQEINKKFNANISENDFEQMCANYDFYILNNKNREVVLEVPLTNIQVIDLISTASNQAEKGLDINEAPDGYYKTISITTKSGKEYFLFNNSKGILYDDLLKVISGKVLNFNGKEISSLEEMLTNLYFDTDMHMDILIPLFMFYCNKITTTDLFDKIKDLEGLEKLKKTNIENCDELKLIDIILNNVKYILEEDMIYIDGCLNASRNSFIEMLDASVSMDDIRKIYLCGKTKSNGVIDKKEYSAEL